MNRATPLSRRQEAQARYRAVLETLGRGSPIFWDGHCFSCREQLTMRSWSHRTVLAMAQRGEVVLVHEMDGDMPMLFVRRPPARAAESVDSRRLDRAFERATQP